MILSIHISTTPPSCVLSVCSNCIYQQHKFFFFFFFFFFLNGQLPFYTRTLNHRVNDSDGSFKRVFGLAYFGTT
ncbi:hypothetical protein Hanom_Chr09g00780581 [Helianthus anomalus]